MNDQFCKAEAEELSYLENINFSYERLTTEMQKLVANLRKMKYKVRVMLIGRVFILPSTNVGGEQNLSYEMHDIIATSN